MLFSLPFGSKKFISRSVFEGDIVVELVYSIHAQICRGMFGCVSVNDSILSYLQCRCFGVLSNYLK